MQAIFLNTFYAENLSGASYAVNKRLELFLRHQVDTKIMTTTFYLTNRYYFGKHFPSQKDAFFDFTNVVTNTINVNEKEIKPDKTFFNTLGFQITNEKNKAVSKQSNYVTWITYPDGRILEISYYNRDNQILRKDGYDHRGFLCLKSYYEINEDNHLCLTRREHLNQNGNVMLTYFFTLDNKLRKIFRCVEGGAIYAFNNENELLLSVLKEYTKNRSENYVVIADLFITDTLAKLSQLNEQKNVALFVQLHNIQYKQTREGNPIRIGYSYPVLNNELYKGLIVLTDRQKRDVDSIIQSKNNIYTIPENWFSKTDVNNYYSVNWDDKEDGLVIISARLDAVKQIDQAISAVIFAHKRVPKIHLEIWGNGSERETLEQLIEQHNAGDYIFLKGTLDNVSMKKRISESQLHLLTSKNEGLPMVLFEAQLGQTPSICYDIDYGPDAIINNRINGDLIAPNDTKYLAMRLEELFKDEKQGTLRQYAFNTRATLDKYSESSIWSLWESLIKQAFNYENYNHRES
ncbi:putative glycosyl transferase [Leuconostoc kimchii IMSNU 11154]|uniref:Putative glycosyl transferase n=1 Tax=Leuconostoc kimchii (strain IMSNU 11154 / KCTC 2386 / IH25) TaxID=762051 RepID=D5T4W7_LEUKI|nr:glycosyltransferase [Leuconostoc kimchii]ADG41119.1 putative glycosyl transferase [Leuconostoc kimchii IMSNU 11154]